MTQLTVKQAKALTSAYDKTDGRDYPHQIEFKDGAAVWSDSVKLFMTKVPGEVFGQVKVSEVKELAQIAKVKKEEAISVEPTEHLRPYPPYKSAFPKEIKQSVTYNINVLMQTLKFLKENGNAYVKLGWEDFNRPLQLDGLDVREKQPTGDVALIVPVRF